MCARLDFERIDSGRLVLVHRTFKLASLLHGVRTVFRPQAASKGVALTFKPIPPALAERRFVGDARRLHQCLSNGVSNAVRFHERRARPSSRPDTCDPRSPLHPSPPRDGARFRTRSTRGRAASAAQVHRRARLGGRRHL